jgi:hypothetical protein
MSSAMVGLSMDDKKTLKCQKEVFWPEKHGVPVISVDARWNLQHAPSVMVFDSSP